MFGMIKRLIGWTGKYKKRVYIGFIYAFINSIFTSLPIMLATYGLGLVFDDYKGIRTFDNDQIIYIFGTIIFWWANKKIWRTQLKNCIIILDKKIQLKEVLHMSNYNTNKRYFETVLSKKENICKAEITLNIANIMITQCYNDISYIGYEAKSTTKSTICKHCLKEITRFKQYKTTYTIYAKYNSKIILLKLSSKQYYCQDCKKTTTEKLIDKKEKKQKTKNFTQTIIDTLQENVNYSMIARTHKISVSNVIRCFDEVSKQIEISKDKDKIKHISIDELRFVKSKQANYQFIIVDTTTRKIQEILQDRKQSVIKEHLKDNYKNIQTVSQDLWKPYKTVVKSLYEEVEIIPDRFHVVRQFTWAFTRERIKLQKKKE